MTNQRIRTAFAALALLLTATGLSACESEGYTHALPIDGASQPSNGASGAAKQATTKR